MDNFSWDKRSYILWPSRGALVHSSNARDLIGLLALSRDLFARREMLTTPGPFLLDVMVPHVEHVLPMIPGGASFKEVITDGDGTREY